MSVDKVAGNAGHHVKLDSGAVGPSGSRECDMNKDITERVLKYLDLVGYKTLFIQEDDLDLICQLSDNFEADVFFSVHCNSSDDPRAHGMEIFTTVGETEADPLATFIMNQLSSSEPTINLTVRSDWSDGDVDKERGFYVIKNTQAPAVLIEVAFISNPDEEKIFNDPNNRDLIAASIARGITDYVASKKQD